MSTDPIVLFGWALFVVVAALGWFRNDRQQVLIFENRLRQVLTRRGMTIESLHSRDKWYESKDGMDFDVIFITPRDRKIQGVFRVGSRWSRLLFGKVRFLGRTDRPGPLDRKPKTWSEIVEILFG